jgi:hypothetical protein
VGVMEQPVHRGTGKEWIAEALCELVERGWT